MTTLAVKFRLRCGTANDTYGNNLGIQSHRAGDHFFNGSPLLAHTLLPDSIYTKTQPIQWAPENFGGGPAPAPGRRLTLKNGFPWCLVTIASSKFITKLRISGLTRMPTRTRNFR